MKKITIEKMILFLAAAFAAYNYGLAGGFIEDTTFSAGGLIAGLVVNVSLAIAASRYGSIKGDKRIQQARVAFVVMMLLSPLLVSPVIYYRLPETFLTPWLRWAWSIGWPLVADLAIVLAGAVSGKGLITLSEEDRAHSEPHSEGSAGRTRRTVRSSADAVRAQCAALQAQYACTHPQCGWSPSIDGLIQAAQNGKSPKNAAASAKAGHIKNQHTLRTNSGIHKPIAIDESLLINQQGAKK